MIVFMLILLLFVVLLLFFRFCFIFCSFFCSFFCCFVFCFFLVLLFSVCPHRVVCIFLISNGERVFAFTFYALVFFLNHPSPTHSPPLVRLLPMFKQWTPRLTASSTGRVLKFACFICHFVFLFVFCCLMLLPLLLLLLLLFVVAFLKTPCWPLFNFSPFAFAVLSTFMRLYCFAFPWQNLHAKTMKMVS